MEKQEKPGKGQLKETVSSYVRFRPAAGALPRGGVAECLIFNSVGKTTFLMRCFEPSIRSNKRRAAVAPS